MLLWKVNIFLGTKKKEKKKSLIVYRMFGLLVSLNIQEKNPNSSLDIEIPVWPMNTNQESSSSDPTCLTLYALFT